VKKEFHNFNKCEKCGSKASPSIIKGIKMIQCCWKPCRHRFALYNMTIFSRMKTKPWRILNVLDCWMAGASSKLISFITHLSIKKIRRIIRRLREMVVPRYYSSVSKIGEKDHIVEIDESKFGKRKYNKGHAVDGVWILGMVDRTTRKIYLVSVEKRDSKTLKEAISEHVNDDSIIYTDCWKGYNGIKDNCASHQTVNHSKFFKDPETGVHTNTIEGNWCAVKSQVPYRNRTQKQISLYLIRFMIKRNDPGDPLINLLNYL